MDACFVTAGIVSSIKPWLCDGYFVYSGEYDICEVTLSVYPHRASLKNMPDHGRNRTYDLWDTRITKNDY